MRKTVAAAAAVFVCLLIPAQALALHDDPGGGGPRCYWTWDGRYVCGP